MYLFSKFVRSTSIFATLLLGNAISSPAQSANIEQYYDPVMECDIRVSGIIGDGDSLRLNEVIDGRSGVLAGYRGPVDESSVKNICFDSPGGSLIEAIRIAEIIKSGGIGTAVGSDAICESACAVAFMAGSQYFRGLANSVPDRNLHSTARLGFHAPELRVPRGTFDNNDLQKAYALSLFTISTVVNFYGLGAPSNFPYGWFIETPHDQMRYVETIGEALLLGINVVDLPPPDYASVRDLQRACEIHLSISRFHTSGAASEGGMGFLWQSFTDVEVLQKSLFPFEQRSNPWELWNFSRSNLERQGSMVSRLPNTGELQSLDLSLPMEDAGGGERGQSFSSCDVSLALDEQNNDQRQNSGIIGNIEYLSNPSLNEAVYSSRLLIAHLYDPWTRLRDTSESQQSSIFFREWMQLLERDIGRLLEIDHSAVTFQSCWLTSAIARVSNVSEYVNMRATPDFSASVVRQIPIDEQVRTMRTEDITIIGEEQDRQSCISACRAVAANTDDSNALNRAQQCTDDNMLWYEITDGRGNTGWVSRKFLKEIE